MDLILISSNKLKVTLSEEEILKYDIPIPDGTASISESRSIHTLLYDIQRMSGFDTSGNNLLVEIFESYGGGCEMFITKTNESKKKHYLENDIREICRNCMCQSSRVAYTFTCIDDLISACRVLYNTGIQAYSSAYLDRMGAYYLLLRSPEQLCEIYTEKLLVINEFGKQADKKFLDEYLSEFAKPIYLDGAIQALANM